MAPPPPKTTHFSTGIKFQSQHGFLPEGPMPPALADIGSNGYIKHIRAETLGERAGGFQTNISCLRAIQEALVGLYHGC
ncbi:hypothetical protein quinque_000601 [Culex quinquefasciatus]